MICGLEIICDQTLRRTPSLSPRTKQTGHDCVMDRVSSCPKITYAITLLFTYCGLQVTSRTGIRQMSFPFVLFDLRLFLKTVRCVVSNTRVPVPSLSDDPGPFSPS